MSQKHGVQVPSYKNNSNLSLTGFDSIPDKRSKKKGEVELGYLLTRIFLSFTNIFNESLKKGIIKSNLSDHLPIFFSISTSKLPQNSSPLKLKKHFFNESNLASFKSQIRLGHLKFHSVLCKKSLRNIPKYF